MGLRECENYLEKEERKVIMAYKHIYIHLGRVIHIIMLCAHI